MMFLGEISGGGLLSPVRRYTGGIRKTSCREIDISCYSRRRGVGWEDWGELTMAVDIRDGVRRLSPV